MATITKTASPKAKLAESLQEFEEKVVKYQKRRKHLLFDPQEILLINTSGEDLTKEKFTIDLKGKLLEVPLELTTLGASVIQLVVNDPYGELLNDPLFYTHWKVESLKVETEKSSNTANEEVEGERVWALPEKSIDLNLEGIWFRLIGFTTQETQLTLTFEDRVAAILREERGDRISAKRGEVTRAQFIEKLVTEAEKGKFGKNYGKIPFFCPEENIPLKVKKKTAKESEEENKAENKETSTTAEASSTTGESVPSGPLDKSGSEGPGELTELSPAQAKVATELLEIVKEQGGNEVVAWAIICSGIIESGLGADLTSTGASKLGGSARGVLQGESIKNAGTKNEALYFCKGGEGFQGGGAIALSKTITSPQKIVYEVEKPESQSTSEERSTQVLSSAKNIVAKFNGTWSGRPSSSGTSKPSSTTTPYEFTRGTNQNSWECMQKLAEGVGWYLFVRNNILFYCSGNYLLNQKSQFTLEAHKQGIYWTNVSVDLGSQDGIAEVEVLCHAEDFEAVPGEAVTVQSIGPASGAWVVMTATQNLLEPAHQVTAKLEKPLPQKEESVKNENSETKKEEGSEGTALAAFNAASEMSEWKLKYSETGKREFALFKEGFEPGVDCSGSTSWMLHKAGMLGGLTSAGDSTSLETWGESGTGKEMTVWTNAHHAFTEFNIAGHQRAQFNTSGPQNGPRLYTMTSANSTYEPSPASETLDGEKFQARHWKNT